MKIMIMLALFIVLGTSAYAGCGSDGNGTWCESTIAYVGFGGNGSTRWSEGVVYVTLTDDGSWFWDNSLAKNMTLSTLLTARTSGQKVQIRWVAGDQGIGSKKITSVLLLP